MIRTSAVRTLVALVMLAATGTAQSAPLPPRLPSWPCTAVATLKLPHRDSYARAVLAAELDGHAGDELVTVTDAYDAAGKPIQDLWQKSLTVYTWRNAGFRRLAQHTFSLGLCEPVVGDVDRDGRDKIYAVSKSNALLTMGLVNGKLEVIDTAHLGNWTIECIAVGDVRKQGVPELLLAVDPTQKFGSYSSQGEPYAQLLLAYGRVNGKWVRTWQQAIKHRGAALELRPGDYHPLAGTELVFEHDPDEFTTSLFELWHWNGTHLARLAEIETVAASRTGLERWVGVSDRLTDRTRTIVANVDYDTYASVGSPTSRVELLQWNGGNLHAQYQLPGKAAAIADVRGSGHVGILVEGSGNSFTLYEPLRSITRPQQGGTRR